MAIEIMIKKSPRAKHVRLSIAWDGTVTVTQPVRASDTTVRTFVESKQAWIEHHVCRIKNRNLLSLPSPSKTDFIKYKREAKLLVLEKLRIYNAYYKTTWGTVTIKNTRTRWGSCSKTHNLNFSYRIVFLPEHLQNYLVVHELCHTKIFDHSRAFWSLVGEQIPKKDIREFKKRAV